MCARSREPHFIPAFKFVLLGSNDFFQFLKVTLDYGATTLEPRDGAVSWSMPHDVLEAA